MNNPFTSKIYELTWLKYFSKHKKGIAFNFVDDLKFYKHPFLPFFINVGRNSTNGITYSLDFKARDYKKKTLLIYDVPSYCNIEPPCAKNSIKSYSINQYKGYLANLKNINSFDEYLSANLSRKSRNKFRGYLKKFETCFEVDYTIYQDFIPKDVYNKTIDEFKDMIGKRFEVLKIDTNLIGDWSFYRELIYKMILDGKAILVAISANNTPVSMSLAFLGNESLIGAIKVFDTDYYKFNVGHIEISKLLEFSIDKNLKYFDFSKGTYEYKHRWTNFEYQYNCHILYDDSSLVSRTTAKLLASFFKLKQYLRDKNFNFILVKLKFKLRNWNQGSINKTPYKIEKIEKLNDINSLSLVNLEKESLKYTFLNRLVYDNLYKTPEPFLDLKIYTNKFKKPTYFVISNLNSYKIEII